VNGPLVKTSFEIFPLLLLLLLLLPKNKNLKFLFVKNDDLLEKKIVAAQIFSY